MLINFILKIIDFFYPPFSRFLPKKTFRYGVTGSLNSLLNIFIYFISYNYLLKAEVVQFGSFAIAPYIGAYLIAFSVSFPVGFLLNKYVVFQQKDGRGRLQLILYATLCLFNAFMDYALLHLLVGYFGFWATPSQALIIVFMAGLSYLFQTHVTFRKRV